MNTGYIEIDPVAPSQFKRSDAMGLGSIIAAVLLLLAFIFWGRNAHLDNPIGTTPSSGVWSVWWVVIIALIALLIYNFLQKFWVDQNHHYFMLACLCAILWFLFSYINVSFRLYLKLACAVGLVIALLMLWHSIMRIHYRDNLMMTLYKNVIGFFLGWAINLLALTFASLLHYHWGVGNRWTSIWYWIVLGLLGAVALAGAYSNEGADGLKNGAGLIVALLLGAIGAFTGPVKAW